MTPTPRTRNALLSMVMLTVVAPVLLMGSCGDDAGSAATTTTTSTEVVDPQQREYDPAVAEMTFEFTDSSVPPEHHRSFTVTASGHEVNVVVDSYGDVLHDVTEPMPAEAWEEFLADGPGEITAMSLDVEASEAESKGEREGEGDDGDCAGGTSSSIRLTQEGETRLSVDLDSCTSEGSEQSDELRELIKPLLENVDMEALLATE